MAIDDKFTEDVSRGLLTRLDYLLDTEQTGRVRIETTRALTVEELSSVTEYLTFINNPGMADLGEWLSIYTGHGRLGEIFDMERDSFIFYGVPLDQQHSLENGQALVESLEELAKGLDGIEL